MHKCIFFEAKWKTMRYFAELAYRGTNYHGWQKQLNAPSVQQAIEYAFSTILGVENVVGCGRTDTGVHATQYFMHFDHEGPFPRNFLNRLNKLLDDSIVIRSIIPVDENAHARFDAIERSYVYFISAKKDPFKHDTVWHFPFFEKLNFNLLHESAKLLLDHEYFAPFCKSKSDAKTMRCHLSKCEWLIDSEAKTMSFHISANRFLRGMVRLVVGMCLNVALGKMSLDEVKTHLEHQTLLKKSWTVPAHGLFLTSVKYPYRLEAKWVY